MSIIDNELLQEESTYQQLTVFSSVREICIPPFELPDELILNARQKMDGIKMMKLIPNHCITAAFFDPQYRGILDKMEYGNEGKSRGKARCSLEQMTEDMIHDFIVEIDRLLINSGHIFLWMDKFHLCTGFHEWFKDTKLEIVDMITWNKCRMGMGYRTRRICEYLVILQRPPKRAKGVWKTHNIPDVWAEKVKSKNGVHPKPIELQCRLIEAVSNPGDLILDPAAGSFSVLDACEREDRNFIGCDLNG